MRIIQAVCLVAALHSCSRPQEITTFILVRHAEKADEASEDPPLMAEGEARAEDLKRLLKETAVDAVYSTPFRRTRSTATPLALDKGIDIREYTAFEEEEIQKMYDAHRGGTVVVVGHSDTTPWTANVLVGHDAYGAFESEDYDNILIVDVVEPGREAKVTWLTFGSTVAVQRTVPSM